MTPVLVAAALVLAYYGRVVRLVGEPLARRALAALLDRPADRPAGSPASSPARDPASSPARGPATDQGVGPAGGPATGAALSSAATRVRHPAGGPARRPVGGPVRRPVGSPAGRSGGGLAYARRWSAADLDGVVRLLLAGVMQAGFVLLLVAALPVRSGDLWPAGQDLRLLLLGVPLGVAEAGLATYVGYLGSRIAERITPGRTPTTVAGWLTVARGGWIRYYLRTAAAFPPWLLIGATLLYVGGEEIVFRGVVLTSAAGLPAAAAVVLSTALFAAAQVFYTPGWRTALFPVLGAVVLGIVHGCLYLATPQLAPLVVAHATMFLVTVL